MDPITMLLIGGGIVGGLGKIFGGIFGKKAEQERLEALRRAYEEAYRRAVEARMPFIRGLQETGRRMRELGLGYEREFRGMVGKFQRAYEEYRRGLEAGERRLREEYTAIGRGLEERFRERERIAREGVGRAYEEAIQRTREFTRGEIARHMESLGLAGGSGIASVIAGREMERATLPLLQERARAEVGLEETLLAEAMRTGRDIAGLQKEMAGISFDVARQIAGLGVEMTEREQELLGRALQARMMGEEAFGRMMAQAGQLLPLPSPAQFYQYSPGFAEYMADILSSLGEMGMGVMSGAMSGMAGGGGGG